MTNGVICRECGKENEQHMAEKYGVCTNCGADLRAAKDVPVQETAMPAGGPPPPYGYQGPPSYPPPPGQQPYPPPGYPGGPMFTNHPGLYERPEEPPRLDMGKLPGVLFSPRQTFYDLYHHTSAAQGWMLVATSLVFWLIKAGASPLRPNKEKTFGLVGYAKFPAFIMGIILSLGSSVWMAANPDGFDIEPTPGDPMGGLNELCGFYLIYFLIAMVQFIWALVVHSHAASVANDTRLGPAVIFTFLGWFIAFWILVGVSILIGLVIAGVALSV
jgi:hypothetical protein